MKKGRERIEEELKFMRRKAPLASMGGSAGPINKNNINHWQACFVGPPGSLYEGGLYYLEIIFPSNYPDERPLVRMRTPIYHPNIKLKNGFICVDYLSSWKKEYNIVGVVNAVYLLLSLNKEPSGGWNGFNSFDPEKARDSKKNASLSQKYNWDDVSWQEEIRNTY